MMTRLLILLSGAVLAGVPAISVVPAVSADEASEQVLIPHSFQYRTLEKEGAVSWDVLQEVSYEQAGGDFVPVFGDSVKELMDQDIMLHGFMLPLNMEQHQSHFLLTANPPTCPFCLEGGPESFVEIKATRDLRMQMTSPVSIEGTFEVIEDDPMGMLYRLRDAELVDE